MVLDERMQEWHPFSWSSALELQDILIPWSLPFWTISGSVEEKRTDKMSVVSQTMDFDVSTVV